MGTRQRRRSPLAQRHQLKVSAPRSDTSEPGNDDGLQPFPAFDSYPGCPVWSPPALWCRLMLHKDALGAGRCTGRNNKPCEARRSVARVHRLPPVSLDPGKRTSKQRAAVESCSKWGGCCKKIQREVGWGLTSKPRLSQAVEPQTETEMQKEKSSYFISWEGSRRKTPMMGSHIYEYYSI